LSDFQKWAIEAILLGQHVLITAHTGSGKTLPAEFAIRHFTEQGKKVIYTAPIKALSNQKYYDFTQKYPNISFGLFTGDIKTNPEADVLIMTTEILMNALFTDTISTADSLQFKLNMADVGCVVFDEIHYINDVERGQTWEKTILMLPHHIQMVMLSATIDSPERFAKWCERGTKEVYLASTNHRVVPLSHYGFLTTTEQIFKIVKDKTIQKQIRDSTNKLILLQNEHGTFQDAGSHTITSALKLFNTNRVFMKRKHVLNQLAQFLKDREMLPAIAFVFSRKNVEICASEITVPLLEDDSKVPYIVARECEQMVRKLPNYREYLDLPEYKTLVALLEKGVGIHHSGMIPILREIVELMISKKYIKLLFATESFAIGLDCPIKTAVFTSLTKFDGKSERHLLPHEYTQMAGRAGRRGIDTIGYVVHCNNLFDLPFIGEYKDIMCGCPQSLISKFYISYSLILHLIRQGNYDFIGFIKKSMVWQELEDSIAKQELVIATATAKIQLKMDGICLMKTPLDSCLQYIELEESLIMAVNKKRKTIQRDMLNIYEMWHDCVKDSNYIKELTEMKCELSKENEHLNYLDNYIDSNVQSVCTVLTDHGFIEENVLTDKGKLANVAEIHPLIFAEMMEKWNAFAEFTPVQIVGLFSCFTDVKIQDKSTIPLTDTFLKTKINELMELSDIYALGNYLIFDIIDISMQWCECDTEEECKALIQTIPVAVGDFTKALLKINVIIKEIMTICDVELLHKLSLIEPLLLKYITTSQSLYV